MSIHNKLSSYPNGFRNGVSIKGMPILNSHSAKIFFVDSNSTGNKGSFEFPFKTLDAANNVAVADRGDIIMVKANHAETIIADSGVDLDVSGVSVVGLGNGENRPTFTFTTAAAADFKIAAANVAIMNLVFKCNIASQAMMIEVTGKDSLIDYCEFREGSATGLTFITYGVADNDSDRGSVTNSKFYMPTAGNGDAAISLAKDHIGLTIAGNEIYGDFDLAGIDVPAGGNAQVNLVIRDNVITNLLTGQHAIQINGTGSTGKIINNQVETDAIATAIDAGGLEPFANLWSDGTDQASAIDPFGALAGVDGAGNFIGADNSNNAAATTNVAANEDGSVLERLEQIQEVTNKGTGTALSANKSLVDAIGTNGVTYVKTDGTLLGVTGLTDIKAVTVTSSDIPNNTQSKVLVTATNGNVWVEDITVNSNSTGLATPTNIEITSNNVSGLTGAGAPILLEPTASFGANATVIASDFTTAKLPFWLENGKALYIHGDDAAGTGGGTALFAVKYRRGTPGAYLA